METVIDRPLISPPSPVSAGLGAALVDVDPYTTFPDGSMEIDLSEGAGTRSLADAPFGANLAEYLPESALQSISTDLRFAVDEDRSSRRDWEDALTRGLDLLGIKSEERDLPWPGACGVVHPMILEAAVRFQSKSIMRLFPPTGPANAKIMGQTDERKLQQAKRVAADMNYWLTDKMPEYRDESEQLLFALAVDGSAFKKIYQDPLLRRPCAQFIPANDFLMPYGFPNLETCPRYTHVMRKSYGDVERLQGSGFYRDIPLSRAPIQIDRVEEKVVRLAGMAPSYTRNDLLTLWESHVDLMLDGDDQPRPYIVTLEYDTQHVLGLYRNWREEDPEARKILSFCHYRYVPWKGAYGLGLVHLIGGIGRSSTSILRQLVDAGTLSNLPGGLKSRQLRIKGDNEPIQPGEFRDADVPAGKILDSIAFLPYKEPSNVLFQLLQMLIEEGKSFASIAELDIPTSASNAPVGSILALLERATEVITAVQSRLHTTLSKELSLIAGLIRDHTAPAYDYDPANRVPRSAKAVDYAQENLSIIPVSDPAAATMAQRVMEYQAALQLSAQAPQLYNLPLLHRSMLEVLGIDNADEIVPDKTSVEAMDPVAENMALLTSKPVKAFEWQNHQAHLQVHMNAMNDPRLAQALAQNPLAASIQSASWAHINEHLAFLYRQQIEQQTGVPLPPLGSNLPPEVEEQISSLVAAASQKLLAANQAQAQQQQNQQQAQDPIVQQQQAELQLKTQGQQQKAQTDQTKLQLEATRIAQQGATAQAQMASEERRTAMEVDAENTRHQASEMAESHRTGTKEHAESIRHMMDAQADLNQTLAPDPGGPDGTPAG
ncbi:MAG TPA: hypothetical protein VH157_07030 [Bryobacteraceae bacterium]|jgi:hypothetical protein|nr:hypothetical protein [Bryobacteraceae bacterium]